MHVHLCCPQLARRPAAWMTGTPKALKRTSFSVLNRPKTSIHITHLAGPDGTRNDLYLSPYEKSRKGKLNVKSLS